MLKADHFRHKQHSMNSRMAGLDSVIEYERQIRQSGFKQNPIIVIPGILGSNIADLESESTLWGDFGGGFCQPEC